MAREKGMGNLQREKSGRWTMRVGIDGKRYCRSTRTKDRDQAERVLQRLLAPLGLGNHRLPLADVWLEYVKSPNRSELARSTLESKRKVWMQFANWMEHSYLPVKDLSGITSDMITEYLACVRAEVCATTYNGRVCVLREIFHTLAAKAGLEDDPWEGVRLRPDDSHSRRELTMGELKRLLEAAKRYDEGEKLKVGVEVEERGSISECVSAGRADVQYNGASRAVEQKSPHRSSTLDIDSFSSTQTIKLPKQSNNSQEWHTLFLIGIYTGLRLGDCCRLDWSSINIAQGVIQLIPRKTRRHAHGRPVTIPIHPALGAALLGSKSKCEVEVEERNSATCATASLTSGEDAASPLAGQHNIEGSSVGHSSTSIFNFDSFSGPVLPRISEMYAKGSWRVAHGLSKIFKAANITTSVKLEGRRHKTPEATFHSLRHTFVSFAANAGVPLHIVQSIVGHESTAMTRHYYHENIAALQSAVAAIPTL